MDLTTFGSSPAAITLATILNRINDKKLNSRVSTTLMDFKTMFDKALRFKEPGLQRKFLYLLRSDFEKNPIIDSLPDEVKSYAKNVGQSFFKVNLRKTRTKK